MGRNRFAAFLVLFSIAINSWAFTEEVVRVPVRIKDTWGKNIEQDLVVTIFRNPEITKPQKFMVLNHGRSNSVASRLGMKNYRPTIMARHYSSQGFVVISVTRIGYGDTGGPDLEDSGGCQTKKYFSTYQPTGDQLEQVIAYVKALPYVNPDKGIVGGISMGGTMSTLIASRNIPGIRGVVNFAGGGGGDPDNRPKNPCRADLLEDMFEKFGETAKTPALFLYTENDMYFGPDHPKDWAKAYAKKGAPLKFHMLPAFSGGPDGHQLFFTKDNMYSWRPIFDEFLDSVMK